MDRDKIRVQENFRDTVLLMRKYMERVQPQSFAAMYGLYLKQKRQCEIYGVLNFDSTLLDIEEYARKERIERFGFGL